MAVLRASRSSRTSEDFAVMVNGRVNDTMNPEQLKE